MKSLKRKPTTPGEILDHEYLKPLGLTQRALAHHLGCDIKVVNRIVNERSAVSAEIALKLAATFETSPDFWLNAQKALDLYRASSSMKKLPKPILAPRLHGTRAA